MPAEYDLPEGHEPPAPAPEAPPVEEPAAPEAVEPAPEFVPYLRADGTEAQLPYAAAQQIAEAMGFENPAVLSNKLREADEAAQILREAREYYRRGGRRTDAEYQNTEAQRQRSYQRPQYQPPQYQPQPAPSDDDPIALLRQIREDNAALRNEFSTWQEQQRQASAVEYEKNATKLAREADHEYSKFASELKGKGIPEWKIPDRDMLLEEADSMGMFNSDMSIADIYRRVHRMIRADDYAQAAVRTTMERNRDPKARIPVPASRPAPPSPPQKAHDAIDQMPVREFFNALPEGKF